MDSQYPAFTMVGDFLLENCNLAMVLGLIVLVIYTLWYRYWWQAACVGPKPWPFLGACVEQLRNYERLHDWILAYLQEADTVLIKMPFGFTYIYTTNPDNVEYMLKSNFSNYPKGARFHENMEELLGDGIFNSDGELWRQQRKTASFEFASRVLRDYSTAVFRDYAQKLANILGQAAQRKDPIDMQDVFMRLTLDSICKIGFGVDLGCLTPLLPENPFATAFDQANYIVTLRFIDPLWKIKRLLNVGSEARLKHSLEIIDGFTYNLIKTRRAEMASLALASKTKQEVIRPDILSRFIVLSEDPQNKLNDKSLRDVVLNFVIAGRDTTAVTLSWFTYMLSLHEEVATKIHLELCEFEKKESQKSKPAEDMDLEAHIACFSQLLNYDTVTNLSYLHASLSETLRLYPAVPEDPKGVLADDVLPTGMKVKKGSMITYSPFCMGRSKAIWGDDALCFKPDRWLKDGVFQPVSPFKFTTFQSLNVTGWTSHMHRKGLCLPTNEDNCCHSMPLFQFQPCSWAPCEIQDNGHTRHGPWPKGAGVCPRLAQHLITDQRASECKPTNE